MSLWETQEVHDELNDMWQTDDRPESQCARSVVPEEVADPDAEKPRATVRQYAALIAQKVHSNLEGLARARLEKRPRPYQTDAEMHQSYLTATSGGSLGLEGRA